MPAAIVDSCKGLPGPYFFIFNYQFYSVMLYKLHKLHSEISEISKTKEILIYECFYKGSITPENFDYFKMF